MTDRPPDPEPPANPSHPAPEAPAQIPPAPFAPHSDVAEPGPTADAAPEPVPEPSATADPVPEPVQDAPAEAASEPAAEPAPEAGTSETLALPPTTKEIEPPAAPSAPPPPSGVPVPFATPPIERDSSRFTVKLVLSLVGGFTLVGGVIVAIVVAFGVFVNSIAEKVEDTAADFMAEVAAEDWDAAHALLCDDLRQRSADSYVVEWESWDAEDAAIGPIGGDGSEVRVRLTDGTELFLTIEVDEGSQTLDMSVCGWREA